MLAAREGPREMCQDGGQVRGAKTKQAFSRPKAWPPVSRGSSSWPGPHLQQRRPAGTYGQHYLEGLVYGREMANTLAYCSAAKFL